MTSMAPSKKIDVLTLVLLGIAGSLVVLLFCTRGLLEKEALKSVDVPTVVTEFLDEFVVSETTAGRQQIVEKYFSSEQGVALDQDGVSDTLRKLMSVFTLNGQSVSGYRVCASKRNYLELMLVDSNGRDLVPRIAFLYSIGGSGRIGSFTVSRLQPLDKSDLEWSWRWQ